MPYFKFLISFFIVLSYLNANSLNEYFYIEDKESKISIKDEFLNPNSKYYTLTIATINSNSNPMEFFQKHNLKNALAYTYGKDKKYTKIISGLYENGSDASNDIENLSNELKENKPYTSKLFRHNNIFNKFKNKIEKKSINNEKLIFIGNSEYAKNLKREFLNKNSNYYSIALGTIKNENNSIEKFFNNYKVEDKALAHLYGKNSDKARIMYGMFKSREEAKEVIESFSKKLKSNSPYAMKMKHFQSFYEKNLPVSKVEEPIAKLEVLPKNITEKSEKPKLSDEIKIIKAQEPKKEPKKEEIVKPKKVEDKKVEKIEPKKEVKKENRKNEFLKKSVLEDVYFVESDGDFNILNEVFLNDGSSFFTIDLGELNLSQEQIDEFLLSNDLTKDALAYKYGENKEYARVIYGAYENEEQAKSTIESLNIKDARVSNIKNHQNLYKEYRKQNREKSVNHENEIVYIQTKKSDNKLKDIFFNYNSDKYTITLSTFEKNIDRLNNFLNIHNLEDDTLAYSIGTDSKFYRVIFGLFDSYNDAQNALNSLDSTHKSNQPYISKISTHQRKFESYNNRKLESFKMNINRVYK